MRATAVPTGLADVPPGPELAAVLASIDRARVSNREMVEVVRARYRLRAHLDAQLAADIADVGLRDAGADLLEVAHLAAPGRFAADELRPALSWSRRKADAELDFSWELTDRLPWVFAALDAGRIDLPKARVFVSYLADLPVERRAEICADVLPKAPPWTTGRLAAHLRKLVISVDPERAQDVYAKAVAQRAVVGYLDANGTATLTAHGLAPEDMASACARVSALAWAIKRAGHSARVDQLRADVFCGLLDGTLHALSRAEIVAHFLGAVASGYEASAQPSDADPIVESAPPRNTDEPTAVPVPGSPRAGTAHGVEVRAEVATLLGRNQRPGELPGWGPILAGNARRTVFGQRGGSWYFAVCDEHGFLLVPGATRYRPSQARDVRVGGTVELQLSVSLLADLAADPPPGWETVIADIAAQYESWPTARTAHDARPARRFPTAGLRRNTGLRDRTCRGPGCRRPATEAQFDHTVDHQHGGPTTDANGGQLCAHDHDLKTRGGWRLAQPEPGVFVWVSPLGQVYRTRGDPVITPPSTSTSDDPPPF